MKPRAGSGQARRDGAGAGQGKPATPRAAPRRRAPAGATAALEQRLRELSLRLLAVQEHERRAVARELHDHYGQVLTAAVIELDASAAELGAGEAAERLQMVATELRALLGDMRDLTLRLRPPLLDEVGLEPALRWLASRVAAGNRMAVDLALAAPLPRLDAEREITVFRIAQEACTNVLRHADARRVGIALGVADGELRLSIRDDGAGFEPEAAGAATRGLSGMRERADLIGARCEIRSAPGQGTEVLLMLPMPSGNDAQA
jgi:signal transduction histidine kinase